MWKFERRWTLAILEAFAPEDSEWLSPRPGEIRYLDTFDRARGASNRLAALGMRVAVWLVALAPFWNSGRARTFATLTLKERTACLERLLRFDVHLVRELTTLLKLTASFALFTSDALRARSHYDSRTTAPLSADASGERPRVALPILAESTKRKDVA